MLAIPTPAVPAPKVKKKAFVRKRCEFDNADELTNLEAVVKAVHPTVMIGTSTQPGTFTESIVQNLQNAISFLGIVFLLLQQICRPSHDIFHDDQDSIEDSLRNAADGRDIRLIVVTDAEATIA